MRNERNELSQAGREGAVRGVGWPALGGCHGGPDASRDRGGASNGVVDRRRSARHGGTAAMVDAGGRRLGGSYDSPLKAFNADNVNKLGIAWGCNLGTRRSLESTPLMIDGMKNAASHFGRVCALNAASGRELWKYRPKINRQWARHPLL